MLMMNKSVCFHNFKIGIIGIEEENGYLTRVFVCKQFKADLQEKTALAKETIKQLEEYFSKKRKQFNLPLAPSGTQFQKKVWQALQNIPFGQTRSYKQIAQNIENEKAFRAVGMACNKNPILFIIPCHRVVGHGGKLTGFAAGLEIKQQLLNLENYSAN